MELKKTGKLFEFCCVAPLIIKKNKNNLNSFSRIGKDVGLLFQIVDDLIDVISDSNTSGKPIGSDLIQGKMTCMVIHAMNSADEELVNLEAILGKGSEVTNDQITMAISDLENIGSIEYCKTLANKYYNISKECLMKFNESNGFEVLSDLTDYHINRIN